MRNIRWPPQKGDIVRLKRGFDDSFEALGARRAGLPLREGALYEVVASDRVLTPVLTLCEVRVLYIIGVRHVTKAGSEQFSYASDRFESVFMQDAHCGGGRP
jgi:hypothetical protein